MLQTNSIPVTKISVNLAVGQETLVAVKDNAASTGYRWQIEPNPGVEVNSDIYVPASAQGNSNLGASSVRVFSIKPIKAAEQEWIERIELLPPSEGAPIHVIEVHIATGSNE